MPPRRCLDCRDLTTAGSYCAPCAAKREARRDAIRGTAHRRGYDHDWFKLRARVVRAWKIEHGNLCPGWQRPAHEAERLTGDHIVPLSKGGARLDPANVQVLCMACNSAKRDRG